MYYKTRWGGDHRPFICELSGILHLPVVEVWVETPAGSKEIRYKDIDRLMYESGSSEGTFEVLAEKVTRGIVEKVQQAIKVTVKVRDPEDPDFWVEAVEEKGASR
jgi:hypothetical protein